MKPFAICIALVCLAIEARAQKQELAFTIGRLDTNQRGILVSSHRGTALQVNYGYRVWSNAALAISSELHFLASPQRTIGGPGFITRDYASLYLTPGVRVKLNPDGHFQPYGVAGAGYALYEQSRTTIEGLPNPAPRHLNRGAVMFGGGVDVPVRHWIAIRGEVRDFFTGAPAYNLNLGGGQHNLVASAGFVLRFD